MVSVSRARLSHVLPAAQPLTGLTLQLNSFLILHPSQRPVQQSAPTFSPHTAEQKCLFYFFIFIQRQNERVSAGRPERGRFFCLNIKFLPYLPEVMVDQGRH